MVIILFIRMIQKTKASATMANVRASLRLWIALVCAHAASGFGGMDFHSGSILQQAIASNSPTIHQSIAIASAVDPSTAISGFYSEYKQALDANPLPVQLETGAVLAVLGDGLAQARDPDKYDTKRAVSFVAFDVAWRFTQHVLYPPLIELCKGQFIAGMLSPLHLLTDGTELSLFAAMEQALISQLVLIPLIYYPVFYAVTSAVQGLSIDEAVNRAKETFIPIMKRNLIFWIPIQFFAFGFVEENLQIPVLIICGLVWTVILSIMAGSTKSFTEEEDPELEVVMDLSGVTRAIHRMSDSEITDVGSDRMDERRTITTSAMPGSTSGFTEEEDLELEVVKDLSGN